MLLRVLGRRMLPVTVTAVLFSGVVMLAASVATASAASCLCFHVLYTGAIDGRVHDSAYNTATKAWSDQILPGSVAAKPNPFGKTVLYYPLHHSRSCTLAGPATSMMTSRVRPRARGPI